MYERVLFNGNVNSCLRYNKIKNISSRPRINSFPDFEFNLKNIKARYKDGILTVNIIKSIAFQSFQTIET